MKLTKNKELRALIKRHEYLRNRPKGVKVLDQILKSVPDTALKLGLTFYVDYRRKAEFKGLTEYKGFNIRFVPIRDSIILPHNDYEVLSNN